MHINKKDLIEFDNGNMNTQEVIEFLSHLDHCDFCLDQMMEQEGIHTIIKYGIACYRKKCKVLMRIDKQ